MKEDKFIDSLKYLFKTNKGMIGIGDDAAVLPYKRDEYLLFTTDTILDGVHFKFKDVNPEYIGYKSVAVNISDIAAMGGKPLYGVINIGLPKYNKKVIRDIFYGIKKISKRYNLKIVGGDTIKSKRLFIALAVIGSVEKKYLVTRSGALAGDIICVTGSLGGSAASGKHYRFIPRLKESRYIVKNLYPTAMIDISDGLLLDLSRVCNESKKGAVLNRDSIPLSKYAGSLTEAVTEGEDFELLFTVKSNTNIPSKVPQTSTKITVIGKIRKKTGIFFLKDGKLARAKIKGYDHFI